MFSTADYIAAFDLTLEWGKVTRRPKLAVNNAMRGVAKYNTWTCTLPTKALIEGEAFAISYAVHEACHFVLQQKTKDAYQIGHGPQFKRLETEVLAMFGLIPTYSRAYIKKLESSSGKVLFRRQEVLFHR